MTRVLKGHWFTDGLEWAELYWQLFCCARLFLCICLSLGGFGLWLNWDGLQQTKQDGSPNLNLSIPNGQVNSNLIAVPACWLPCNLEDSKAGGYLVFCLWMLYCWGVSVVSGCIVFKQTKADMSVFFLFFSPLPILLVIKTNCIRESHKCSPTSVNATGSQGKQV